MSVLTTWAQNACQTVFFFLKMCGCVCQGLVVLAQSDSDAIVCFHVCICVQIAAIQESCWTCQWTVVHCC